MTLQRAITYMVYANNPNVAPDGINQARWSAMYAEISKALREDGNSRTQVRYYMSVDEDFIPDVLSCYNHKPETEYGFFLSKRA